MGRSSPPRLRFARNVVEAVGWHMLVDGGCLVLRSARTTIDRVCGERDSQDQCRLVGASCAQAVAATAARGGKAARRLVPYALWRKLARKRPAGERLDQGEARPIHSGNAADRARGVSQVYRPDECARRPSGDRPRSFRVRQPLAEDELAIEPTNQVDGVTDPVQLAAAKAALWRNRKRVETPRFSRRIQRA